MKWPPGVPLLLVPPQVDMSQPLYALPALAAYARERGVAVAIDDLNVDAYHRLLSAEWLSRCMDQMDDTESRVRAKYPQRRPQFQEDRRRAGAYAPLVMESVEWAKAALRHPDDFYDFDAYTRAMRIVHRALDLISCAHFPTQIGYQDLKMRASPRSLTDVLHAAEDEAENPYVAYFAETVVPAIKEASPPLVGFSLMSPTQFIPAATLARLVKQVLPEVFVVMGGAPILNASDRATRFGLLSRHIDAFVVGDGEETLVQLVTALAKGQDPSDVPNLVSFRDGQPICGPRRDVRMDALPTPDFDGLPLDSYFSPQLNLPVLASKGCYWGKCAFCTNSSSSAHYRARPIARLLDDVEALHRKYRTDVFSVIDDSLSPKQAEAFAAGLQSRDLHTRWRFRTRAERAYTPELCEQLVRAGCRKVYVGLESGSPRTLDRIHKGTDLCTMETVLDNFDRAGLPVHGFCIVGFPGESDEDVQQTVDLLVRHQDAIESMLVAPYVLRRRSAAAEEPSQFGIAAVREDGDGLVDDVEFDVSTGIGPAESGAAAAEALRDVVERADSDDSRYDERHAPRYYLGNRYFSALDAPNFMYHCRYRRRADQLHGSLRRERVRGVVESESFLEARVCLPPGTRVVGTENGAYLLSPATAHFVVLSPTAAEVVSLCGRPVRDVVEAFVDRHRLDTHQAQACVDLIRRLLLDGDLELRAADGSASA